MDIKAQIQQTLKDGMFMNGGNTDAEKNFYSLGFNACAEWMLSQSSELKKENERLVDLIKHWWMTANGVLQVEDAGYKNIINTEWQQFKTENNL